MNNYKTSNIPEKSFYSAKNVILRELGFGKTILDVGCNDGYFGRSSDKTNTFYGLDCSEDSVKVAKENYKDAVVYDLNKLEKLPWDIKFDVLVFADVLELVLFPEKVLIFFVKNYLKEDGKVIVSLPNIANWQVRLKLLFGKFNYAETGIMDKSHLHFYAFKSTGRLASTSNLRVLKKIGTSFFGQIITLLPFLRPLLATNIILILEQ